VKTLAAEHPGVAARTVELPPGAGAAVILHRELHASDPHVEVVYRGGARSILEVVPSELPAPSGAPPLDADSVVLVTGGGRGITAKVAVALARRYGCRVELVGRSPLPAPEDPSLGPAGDARALRALFGKLVSTPAEIEQQCARVLADREIRATISALGALGDRAGYHAVDVRAPAFGALIDELYHRHGRIDAVIHGAGVLEDKLLRHKTPESFERVFATKVAGARTLAERLRRDVRFVVLFSSISGAFGNRGQIDYAAAGDALDKLAASLSRELPGRVVSIDWGPWSGTGMVSAELEREYARRGIGLIDPERGVEALIAELHGGRGDAQVILTASDPRALVRRGSTRSADELDA
jgi:NAD(P)-dependent dehydrogenase (short-subunit alcohol dehydrogenase family)